MLTEISVQNTKEELKIMSEYLLSIVIPVYNVENYLDECINSIKIPDGESIEIILVNDGSTDNSGNICKSYMDKIPNLKYIEQKNQGLSEARNIGIQNARGKYIMFLDSDDCVYEDNLSNLVETIKNNKNENFFIGRAYKFEDGTKRYELCQIDYDSVPKKKTEDVFLYLDSINTFWFAAWLIVINREFLIANQLYFKKEIYHEDELWVPSVFLKSTSIGFINFGFYCYRLNRDGSIISTPNIKREFDKLIIVDEFDKMEVTKKSKIRLIKRRQAALVFGIILKLKCLSKDERYNELISQVSVHSSKMKSGKYVLVYLLYRLLGPLRLSYLLSK